MKRRKAMFIIGAILLVVGVIGLAVYFGLTFSGPKPNDTVSTPSYTAPQPELPDNPIDFTALKAKNPDIYAWIKIPGTEVDYAVLQADDEPEDFYLNHNIDGKYEFAGSIYTQKLNSKNFTDPNTILYGHNMNNGSMFASLHKFRKKEFFDNNKYIYIYTPGHILTYEIYSAYRFDNRHILYAFNLNDKDVFSEYIEMTKNPKSTIVNVRKETQVTADSRIITLSTCITNDNYRYLVQGVLIDDQRTK
ncbi:MAG: class B sortase [Ruminococcaceae bacterium]|nr:class B sortase [Oscillospiraceae bacterium]